MERAVQELLNSPKLALHVRTFNRVLEEERQKREHFYNEVTEYEKAEFINGEIIVHSPAKKRHTEAGKLLLRLLDLYVQIRDLGFVGFEKTLVTLTRNDYEPDLCFFRKEKAQAFVSDQMKYPAPDFIAEILSPSTERRDRGVKFEDYAAHGVGEYWLLDPKAEVVEQYVLKDGRYVLRMKSGSGQIESEVIDGLVIPVRALFDDEANLQEVQRIVQSR
ncbi:MAG: Uma2 family endonuclease [Bacteroidetes bacterium]|nr:Uma2 family endonuclease [Bacteroidota bacterium]